MSAAPGQSGRRPRLVAIVTTLNEERRIRGCLDSLAWCDQLLVVDSYSTDRTEEIAREFPNLRWVQRSYLGAAAQKNWAMDQVSADWVLLFDADERCTPELRQEIESVLEAGPDHEAYRIRRQVFALGRRIRFSGWQNDAVVRLVRRGSGRYPNRRVHAEMATRHPPGRLTSPMVHIMVDDFDEYLLRLNRYGLWGAAQLWREGVVPRRADVVLRPLWRFLRTYLLQLGLLDGTAGLVMCMAHSYAVFAKWSILWGWRVNERRGLKPSLPPFDDDEQTWQFDGCGRLAGGRGSSPAAQRLGARRTR